MNKNIPLFFCMQILIILANINKVINKVINNSNYQENPVIIEIHCIFNILSAPNISKYVYVITRYNL